MEPLTTTGLILFFGLLGIVVWLFYSLLKVRRDSDEKYNKLLSQKKSSEVITGQITEKLAPFLKEFPYNPRQATFLGMPIDYMVFGEKMITFIEIKSGNARLTKKQREIRRLVENKKVEWHEINIK